MTTTNIQARLLEIAKGTTSRPDGYLSKLFGVSTRTVQAWRAGKSHMPRSARAICMLLREHETLVMDAIVESASLPELPVSGRSAKG
jgi:hypothetical protein